MIRKKKLFVKPRKAYEKTRITEENALLSKYALKNKREIWKTLAKINYFRHRAMDLAKSTKEEQETLFKKLNNLGLKINNTADVLALKIENLLERRLPSVIFKKGFAPTIKQARQMVVHRKVLIRRKVADVPSYIVSIDDENNISVKQTKKQVKTESKDDKNNEINDKEKDKNG